MKGFQHLCTELIRQLFVIIFSHLHARARSARGALWLMAEQWSPAPTMVRELPGHRQPIAKFRALTLAA